MQGWLVEFFTSLMDEIINKAKLEGCRPLPD